MLIIIFFCHMRNDCLGDCLVAQLLHNLDRAHTDDTEDRCEYLHDILVIVIRERLDENTSVFPAYLKLAQWL